MMDIVCADLDYCSRLHTFEIDSQRKMIWILYKMCWVFAQVQIWNGYYIAIRESISFSTIYFWIYESYPLRLNERLFYLDIILLGNKNQRR